LIELSAAISGLTLALHESRLIALTGLITGVAMTLSLGATEYLACKSEAHEHPVKAAAYTSGANLVTVVLLILPYFFIHNHYIALAVMLSIAALIVLFFNYHMSVAKDLNFKKSFAEMIALFLAVSALTFLISYAAKEIFHIELH
jgi:VIT1/CCC1 family predicted Fe2+/Mn2+ transporter